MAGPKKPQTPGKKDAPPKLKHVAVVKRAKMRHTKRGKKHR